MVKHITERIFSQSLVSAALDQSFDFIEQVRVVGIYLKVSTNITETITVSRVSSNGSNYTVPLRIKTLNNESSYSFAPEFDCVLLKGDSLRVQCTNANVTGTIYGTIHVEGGKN